LEPPHRLRLVVVAGWFHQPTSQPTVVIYFKKFDYGRLGLPWQPGGHYILQPFALFIYLVFIF